MATAACISLVACTRQPAAHVRIGLLWVMEGPGAGISGQSSQYGARLAVGEINARGGITLRGRRHLIRLIERGYENRPDAAASGARALINLDSIDVLIGPQLSTHAVSASSVAENARVPMISPMSSNPATTEGKQFVFRLAYLDAVQGSMLASYAREELGAKRAATLYDPSQPYSLGIAQLFRETFETLGGTVVAAETFTPDQGLDFRAQLRRIRKADPDVLLLPNYTIHDTMQVRQARELGLRATFLGSDTWDPPSMGQIPEAMGSIVARQWHERMPSPQVAAFIERYRQFANESPRATAALTYDAIHLTAAAIERTGTVDGSAIAAAIAHWGLFRGASGDIVFHGTGDPRRSAILDMILRGSDSVLRIVEPAP